MKLSICIPTYNRRSKALLQFDRVVSQLLEFSSEEIELIISDNASSDDTYHHLLLAASKYPQLSISIQQQVTNLGLVGNLYYLYLNSKGDFVWFISDDDILLTDSIKRVYRLLELKKKFYLLNFNVESNGKLVTFQYFTKCDSYFDLITDQSWGGLGLLSIQIIDRLSFKAIYEDNIQAKNLCQPVAVSMFGLFHLDGYVDFDNIYVTHHQGDYSWQNESLKVFSIYLFDSIISLIKYGVKPTLQIKILQTFSKTIFFPNALIRYIIKHRDFNLLFRLFKNQIGFKILKNMHKVIAEYFKNRKQ